MIESNQEVIDKKVLYAGVVYGEEEKKAVLHSLENQWLASGPTVAEFEKRVAKMFGKKYGVAVNSGSSANLVALSALGLKKGCKVITPALTFATTVSEIVQNGLIPIFIDSVIGRYTINEDLVESAIDDKTAAIMVPQLVGGICDMKKLKDIADRHNLFLIDDCCDTFAPRLHGNTVASYADITTTSFYGSHIITACGMGGMLMTDDEYIRDTALTLRDWGRVGNDKEDFKNRFDFQLDGIPYDSKFVYSHLGYNLKMNEVSAAFGLEQLRKLPIFIKTRATNFKIIYNWFAHFYSEWFYLPELIKGAETNWLAFPLTIKKDAPFTRYEFLEYLEKNGIQTRVLFSGNITRHPIYKDCRYEVVGDLENADLVMANGFLLGCHHAMSEKQAEYMCMVAKEFLDKY